jgi:hypothetical protein
MNDDDAVNHNEPLNRAKEILRREEDELAKIDEIIAEAEEKEKDIHRTEEL